MTRIFRVRSRPACRANEKSAATKQASYWSFRRACAWQTYTGLSLDETVFAERWTCLSGKKCSAPRQSTKRDGDVRNGRMTDMLLQVTQRINHRIIKRYINYTNVQVVLAR